MRKIVLTQAYAVHTLLRYPDCCSIGLHDDGVIVEAVSLLGQLQFRDR